MTAERCRSCGAPLAHMVADLGESPLSNALLRPEDAAQSEPRFPLQLWVCDRCWLAQVPAVQPPERIFGDYKYFSSYSTTWLAHAARYANDAAARLRLGAQSLVMELASNDGYLLQAFRDLSIPVLGIEPAANVAREAMARGVPTLVDFFGARLARELVAEGRRADLLVANNVLAHVPDLNDFIAGVAIVLAPGGTASFEFPHVLRTIERRAFDTIYHEHFSYFSLRSVRRAFARAGLDLVDVDELPTHGGSLRVWVRRAGDGIAVSPAVAALERAELEAGIERVETYRALQAAADDVKSDLVSFLTRAQRERKTVAGYGAPAKATTLLNYCGIGADLLPYTVDRSPHKQGRLIPGVRIAIDAPERIWETKPDYVLILPWNIKEEVAAQMSGVRAWGGRFVVATPRLEVLP